MHMSRGSTEKVCERAGKAKSLIGGSYKNIMYLRHKGDIRVYSLFASAKLFHSKSVTECCLHKSFLHRG